MALVTIETSSMRPSLAIAPHSLAMSGSSFNTPLALREGDEQIGQSDVRPEPRHQAVLAVASSSTAALAVDADEGMWELAGANGSRSAEACSFRPVLRFHLHAICRPF